MNEPFPTQLSSFADPSALADFLLSLFEGLPLCVALLDAEGKVVFANKREGARVGIEGAGQLVGRAYFRDVLKGADAAKIAERYEKEVVQEGNVVTLSTTLSGVQGRRAFAMTIVPVPGNGGARAIAVLEDRSELARERDRRERAERLAAVGTVAAGVAHEVNNPLASIKSFAQLLARDATRDDHREALELIINESTRVAAIVDNLLSYARQQGAGGLEPVNISVIAERVLQMQRYALETAGIMVKRDFDESLSSVMGEMGALQQVVLNLIVNAEQALASHPGDRLLIVRTRESTEGVILSVVDNGPGIPRELLPTIFERFRTTKARGSGLGLSISAAIVRDHSGQIWAESDQGKGAAFYVQLPRTPPDPLLRPIAATAVPIIRAEPKPDRQLKVLIADDEVGLRRALSLFLQRRGHVVLQAADAHEAFALATSESPDVALVDARMPGDGLVLIEKLEALPRLKGRTALMTGDLGRPRTHQGIATGRPYLTKPFDMDEMVRLLESLAS